MALNTPTRPIARNDVEAMLDAGQLYIQMKSGKWWKLRRNGKTQTWKRDPNRFRIPIKFGFKFCGAIDQTHLYGQYFDPSNIRHMSDIPDELRAS